MDDRKMSCPVCGVTKMRPSPHVPSTSWAEGCACNDMGKCVAHRYNPDDAPIRPSHEEMLTRAISRAEMALEDYKEKVNKFRSSEEQASKYLDATNALASTKAGLESLLARTDDSELKSLIMDLIRGCDVS